MQAHSGSLRVFLPHPWGRVRSYTTSSSLLFLPIPDNIKRPRIEETVLQNDPSEAESGAGKPKTPVQNWENELLLRRPLSWQV